MPASSVPAVRLGEGQSRITVGIAALTWLLAWFGGNLVGASLVVVLGGDTATGSAPIWVVVVSAIGLWVPMLAALKVVSDRYGLGSWEVDYGFSFRPIDALGLPIGVLTQLVLVRLVYWPLQSLWPDTFSSPRLEETAKDLWDRAGGGWMIALILVVVIGAPLIEELLYRGLLQGAFVRRVSEPLAVGVVAVWFAAIHFRPVEFPGLFVIGLVLGVCALVTRRLGMGVVAHAAFNATGLIWVATR